MHESKVECSIINTLICLNRAIYNVQTVSTVCCEVNVKQAADTMQHKNQHEYKCKRGSTI